MLFLSSLLLISCLLGASLAPSSGGYEGDIFAANSLFWVQGVMAIQLSVFSILACTESRHRFFRITGMVIAALAIVGLLSISSLLNIPAVGRADPLTHVGIVRDVIDAGHLMKQDFYPTVHLLSASMVLMSDIDVLSSFRIAPSYQWICLALFLVVLARRIRFRTGCSSGGFAFLLAVILPLGSLLYSFLPMGMALVLLPLLVYLAVSTARSKRSFPFVACFLLIGAIMPMTHPLVAVLAIILVPWLGIFKPQDADVVITPAIGWPQRRFAWRACYMAVVTLWWLVSFAVWKGNALRLLESLIGEGSYEPSGQRVLSLIASSSLGLHELFIVMVLTTGPLLILSLLFLLGHSFSGKRNLRGNPTYRLAIIGLGLASIVEITVFIIPTGLDHIRMIWVMTIFLVFAVLSNGEFATLCMKALTMIRVRQIRNASVIFAVILLALSPTIVPFSVYKSPLTFQSSEIVCDNELAGAEYVAENYERSMTKMTSIGPTFRLFFATEGYDEAVAIAEIIRAERVPDHFGYDTSSVAGDSFGSDTWLLLTSYDQYSYSVVWTKANVFNATDFEKLERRDSSANGIADFGDFTLYLIIVD